VLITKVPFNRDGLITQEGGKNLIQLWERQLSWGDRKKQQVTALSNRF